MIRERQSDEPFERKGEWWVPDDPSANRYAGTLKYHPTTGGLLELVLSQPRMPYRPICNSNVIHGEVTGIGLANRYTLIGCKTLSESTHHDRLNTATVQIETIYEGPHFTDLTRGEFSNVEVSFRSLVNWTSEHCLSMGHGDDFKIESRNEEIDIGSIGEFENAQLRHWVYVSHFDNREIPLELAEHVNLYMESGTPRTFDYFDSVIEALEAFFSIATQCWSQAKDIYLSGMLHPEDQQGRPWARVHRRRRFQSEPIIITGSDDHLFNQSDLEGPLGHALSSWIHAYPRLRIPISLYLFALYSDSYVEEQFNLLMQAMESYHRRAHTGLYMDPHNYEESVCRQLVAAIPEELAEDHRTALKSRLKYGNEYSHLKRLAELLQTHMEALQTVMGVDKKTAKAMVDARNALTHFSNRDEALPSWPELNRYADILRALLDACFLSEMGFSPSRISELFKRNSLYDRMFGRYARVNLRRL